MVLAVAKALEDGADAVRCASTGNTSASAAAYGYEVFPGLFRLDDQHGLVDSADIGLGFHADRLFTGAGVDRQAAGQLGLFVTGAELYLPAGTRKPVPDDAGAEAGHADGRGELAT